MGSIYGAQKGRGRGVENFSHFERGCWYLWGAHLGRGRVCPPPLENLLSPMIRRSEKYIVCVLAKLEGYTGDRIFDNYSRLVYIFDSHLQPETYGCCEH